MINLLLVLVKIKLKISAEHQSVASFLDVAESRVQSDICHVTDAVTLYF